MGSFHHIFPSWMGKCAPKGTKFANLRKVKYGEFFTLTVKRFYLETTHASFQLGSTIRSVDTPNMVGKQISSYDAPGREEDWKYFQHHQK